MKVIKYYENNAEMLLNGNIFFINFYKKNCWVAAPVVVIISSR